MELMSLIGLQEQIENATVSKFGKKKSAKYIGNETRW